MAFYEDVRLPVDVERGARGGPGFRTTILPLTSGFEKRNRNWSQVRGKWNVKYGIDSQPNLQGVIDTFYVVGGMADGFRFKDWADYQIGDTLTPDISTRQLIGLTDTTTTDFQIFKRYTVGAQSFDRIINKPVSGTTKLWVNNVEINEGAGAGEFTIDTTTGIITLGSTLAAQSATEVEVLCQFDVPVRFAADQLEISTELAYQADAIIQLPNINVVEIRV